jgi:hypothetical protein
MENNEPIVVVEQHGKAGRPTKYNGETIQRLLGGLADGLPIKSACIIAGISVSTLADWREKYPELEEGMTEAREVARQKMLQRIKRAAEDDWRAAAEWLRLTFPADYRRPASNTSVEVNTAVQTGIVCDEATRKRLIELREQIGAPIPQNALEPHKEKVQAATPPPMLPAPTSLPAPQTQLQGAHGAEKCTVETKHKPIPPPDDGIPKWVKDIGTAESWKHGKGE